MKNRNRRIAALVLCLVLTSGLSAAPWAATPSLFERFIAYVQSKLSPPIPVPQGRLSPPIGAEGRLSPPIPVAPSLDTTGVTAAPTPP